MKIEYYDTDRLNHLLREGEKCFIEYNGKYYVGFRCKMLNGSDFLIFDGRVSLNSHGILDIYDLDQFEQLIDKKEIEANKMWDVRHTSTRKLKDLLREELKNR